jgi:glutaredoxin
MRPPRLRALLALALFGALAGPLSAQFKWVGPDGKVTYSDQPPPVGIQSVSALPSTAPRSGDDALPAALRSTVSKHPVTLYGTPDCAPCQQARAHLTKRGIPFSEKTVSSAADLTAFKRNGFADNSFPALGVGRARAVGFESNEWDRLLDAAGYPQTSVLPPSYRQPPAQALAPPPAAVSNDAGGAAAQDGSGNRGNAARPRNAAPQTSAPPPANALRF